jgi:hypothetical protein
MQCVRFSAAENSLIIRHRTAAVRRRPAMSDLQFAIWHRRLKPRLHYAAGLYQPGWYTTVVQPVAQCKRGLMQTARTLDVDSSAPRVAS